MLKTKGWKEMRIFKTVSARYFLPPLKTRRRDQLYTPNSSTKRSSRNAKSLKLVIPPQSALLNLEKSLHRSKFLALLKIGERLTRLFACLMLKSCLLVMTLMSLVRDRTPKILVSSCRFNSTGGCFYNELLSVIPNAHYFKRGTYDLKKIVEYANNKEFTSIMVVHTNRREPDALLVIGLPYGPTAHFKLSSLVLRKDIKNHGNPTSHKPELVLNNFTTRLGHRIGRLIQSLFPQSPNFRNRRVECGPRFTLKLVSLQHGTFDTKGGEFEWVHKISWAEADFGIIKYQLQKASSDEKDAFNFLRGGDNGNYITYSAFCDALKQLNLTGLPYGLSFQEMKELWVQADLDGNGVLDYEEFKRIWNSICLVHKDEVSNSEDSKEAIGFAVKNAMLFPREVEKGI